MADFDRQDAELRKLIKKQGEFGKLDRLAQEDGLKALVGTYEGRKYFWWILTISRAIGQNAFSGDPVQTAFNCGMQNVGQMILANLMEVHPDAYLKMMKENSDEQRTRTGSADLFRDATASSGGDASGGNYT